MKWLLLKPCFILCSIEKGMSIRKVYKQNSYSYPHVLNVCNDFIEKGLVNVEYIGNEKVMSLTEKGNFIKDELLKIKEKIKIEAYASINS